MLFKYSIICIVILSSWTCKSNSEFVLEDSTCRQKQLKKAKYVIFLTNPYCSGCLVNLINVSEAKKIKYNVINISHYEMNPVYRSIMYNNLVKLSHKGYFQNVYFIVDSVFVNIFKTTNIPQKTPSLYINSIYKHIVFDSIYEMENSEIRPTFSKYLDKFR